MEQKLEQALTEMGQLRAKLAVAEADDAYDETQAMNQLQSTLQKDAEERCVHMPFCI